MKTSKRKIRGWSAAATLGVAVAVAFIGIPQDPEIPAAGSENASWDWREELRAASKEDSQSRKSASTGPSDRKTESSGLQGKTDLLTDRSAPLNEREKEAFRLARESPRDAFKKLNEILDDENEDPRLKAAAAQALGDIDTEAARALAEETARAEDPVVARGAVRGISARGDEEAAESLEKLLYDPDVPENTRMEAALGMAGMNSQRALDSLLRATYSDIDADPSEPVFKDVLGGIAGKEQQEARDFVNGLIDHPDIDSESKIVAIEALVNADGDDVLPTLLKHAASDDAEIREAAMWALAGRHDVQQANTDLANLLKEESAPWVRANLYEAMRVQEEVDVNPFWAQVTDETDMPARLAGINFIAGHLAPDQTSRFDSEIVPELRVTATEDPSLSNRISAIVALGRAEASTKARDALRYLQWESDLDSQTRHAAALALYEEQ